MKSKQSFDLSWYVNGYHIAFRYKSWDPFGLGFQLFVHAFLLTGRIRCKICELFLYTVVKHLERTCPEKSSRFLSTILSI